MYTPNFGFEIAVFVREREREHNRFRGGIAGATREHRGSKGSKEGIVQGRSSRPK